MKIKVGIFFGGPSREREIAFAGGRTVYDNLDKNLFEPIPIFVDSHRNFILLDWEYIYKGTIRDFYPPIAALPASPNAFQVYMESLGELSEAEQNKVIERVGRKLDAKELPQLINLAFLSLHGVYGEDGQLQRELEALRIPYTGSGARACEIGMDKALQKELMGEKGFAKPEVLVLSREEWLQSSTAALYEQSAQAIGWPLVIRPANQGSSIGVSIIDEKAGVEAFQEAVDQAFFRERIPLRSWKKKSDYDRIDHLRLLTDIRDGLGFPLDISFQNEKQTIYHPEVLLEYMNSKITAAEPEETDYFLLEGHLSEEKVILEEFIHGKEFSCIVVRQEDDSVTALPPTEIVKGGEVFDYRSKYMPGLSRKETPIKIPAKQINAIRKECERLFNELGFQTYARIDGFITKEEKIFLNDPNTTSGMLPSSFFFHQAAEIGLNPSQFLTYIIRISLQERFREQPAEASYRALLEYLDQQLQALHTDGKEKTKVGVILGGYSFERHISVESGRNIFEKLASSEKYEPIPVFLAGKTTEFELFQLPINLLLKDNADDIRDKIRSYETHPVIEEIKEECAAITSKYAAEDVVFAPQRIPLATLPDVVDEVFIAIHGRPGEDGQLQAELDKLGLPYNGSGAVSSGITINKYQTLQTLKRNGFSVTDQLLMARGAYKMDPEGFYRKVEQWFTYPFIAKPVDDGCSSAVMVINTREELQAYTKLMFRPDGNEGLDERRLLKLTPKEEFPIKKEILFEQLITAVNAKHFLEVTGGLLTHYDAEGNLSYEVFEPSEALSSGAVLSLEEKFLAGEGQNITPARFAPDSKSYKQIASQVRQTLENAARTLNVQGYARIDAFVRIFEDNSVETIIVEVNSLPGMTPATCIFHQAAINGYKPYEFIDKILTFGQQKKEQAALPTATEATSEQIAATDTVLYKTTSPMDTSGDNHLENDTEQQAKKPEKESFFKPLLSFLIAPIFLRNLGAILLFILLSFFLFRGCMNLYTHHGESLEVHDYRGMTFKEAKQKARKRSFSVVVLDSIYIVGRAPNIVLEQNPAPFSQVKKNRNIYLTITSGQAPEVPLPSLVGNDDFQTYQRKLERLDLKLVVRERKFDRQLEENTILALFYNGDRYTSEDVKRGVKIPKGSTVEAVVTIRNTGTVQIPQLVCKRFSEASFLITGAKLKIGEVDGPASGRDNYYVWKQEPAYEEGKMIATGESVKLFLTGKKPEDCQ